ncbi:putative glucan 1,3-beta-glucosidase [Helianthus anomalus]
MLVSKGRFSFSVWRFTPYACQPLFYWQGIDRITTPEHANYTYSIIAGMNTGIDMVRAHADNLGYQCGGWTIEWQGLSGDITSGTTILSAVKKAVDPKTRVVYNENPNENFVKSARFDYAIVVVGEHPYAETFGDSPSLTIAEPGPSTIKNVWWSTFGTTLKTNPTTT